MKKLIGTVAVAAMIATAAFAEISFGAWLSAIWAPVAYDGEDVKAGLTNPWGWGVRPARLNVNASTEDGRAGMSMGIYNEINGLGAGDDCYLFVKPWEAVKLTLGSADYNLFRGDLCYGSWNWIRPDIVVEDEGLTFESHGKQVKGALIEITPVDGLVMAWGLPVLDGDNYWRDASDMVAASEAAIMYTIADIAKIKVGFKGKNKDKDKKVYQNPAEDGFYTNGVMKFKTNGTYRTFDKKTNTFVNADKDGKATDDAEKAVDKDYGKATKGELMKWDSIEAFNAWGAKYQAYTTAQNSDPVLWSNVAIEYSKEKANWKQFEADNGITTDAQKRDLADMKKAFEWALAEGIINAEGDGVTANTNMDGRADPEWDRYWTKIDPDNLVAGAAGTPTALYEVAEVGENGDIYKYIGDLSIGFDLIAVENMYLTLGAKIGLAQSGYKDINPIDVARIALGFSYQILDNLKLSLSGAFTINSADSKNSFWVGLGLDVGLTDSLSLAADFRFKKTDLGADESVDPMMSFLVGVNYACSSNGSVGIGFQGVINQGFVSSSSSGLSLSEDGGKFGFAIPITASVWF